MGIKNNTVNDTIVSFTVSVMASCTEKDIVAESDQQIRIGLFLAYHFLLPRPCAALWATHISGSAHMHCHIHGFIGRYISVFTVLTLIVACHLLNT